MAQRRPTTPPTAPPAPCPFGLRPLAEHPAVVKAQTAFDANARELAEAEADAAYAHQQPNAVEWTSEAERAVTRLRKQRDELGTDGALGRANAEALAALIEQLKPLWAERAAALQKALEAVQPLHVELGSLWIAVRRACGSTPPTARWPVLPPSAFYAVETALKQLHESLEPQK